MTGCTAVVSARRRAATVLVWLTVAGTWLAAWFVPWTSRGLLSTSSLADGVRLLRGGTVSALVPTWAAWPLLAGPVSGLLLLATATRTGAGVAALRGLLVLVMALALVASWWALAGLDPGRLGPGGWLTTAGVGLGLGGLAEQWRERRNRPAATNPPPPTGRERR